MRNSLEIRIILISVLFAAPATFARITIDQCVALAQENYPLIKKYELLDLTESVTISEINKGWLPRLGVFAQGSVQNAVPTFPDALAGVLDRLGQSVTGLGRLQWKAGVELSQTIWDGGSSKASRDIERARMVQNRAMLDVELYAVGRRVEDLYFSILLMREQIDRTESAIALLEANHRKLLSMFANGTAMRCDADMVEAQILTMRQRQTEARSALSGYIRLLEIYIGEPLNGREIVKPALEIPSVMTPDRPELRLYQARVMMNAARRKAVGISVLPRIGLFAQAYYGYPGFDYFKSMMSRDASLNLLAGIKVSWNIDSFYTRRDSERELILADSGIEAERQLFLFNTNLQSEAEKEAVNSIRGIIEEDARIVRLRASVREAAESQLANGVIDTTALLSKINDENQARLAASYHEIQLLHNISKLKHTLNR